MRDKYASMIPLDEYKRMLGSLAKTLSEQDIIGLRCLETDIADAIFDWWVRNRSRRDHTASS